MSNNLTLSMARKRVREYAAETDSLMANHAEAMECRDCEEWLKRGIDAQFWLCRAEEIMRAADEDGLCEFDTEMRRALDCLYEMWLRPCEFAETWIASLATRGYTPDNLGEFRDACDMARDIVERRHWKNVAGNAR